MFLPPLVFCAVAFVAGSPTTALSHPMCEKLKLLYAKLSKLISVVAISCNSSIPVVGDC